MCLQAFSAVYTDASTERKRNRVLGFTETEKALVDSSHDAEQFVSKFRLSTYLQISLNVERGHLLALISKSGWLGWAWGERVAF